MMDQSALNSEFWHAMERLISEAEIVIDRPKNSTHPRFPDLTYLKIMATSPKQELWMVMLSMYGLAQDRVANLMRSSAQLTLLSAM